MLIGKRTFSAAVAGLLLLLSGIQSQHSVTFSSQSLCVVIGSTVKIPSTFTPGHYGVTERQWYRVQSSEGEPQDLRKDPEYSRRVSVNTRGSVCSLTVRNVRVSDSGVYNYRFKTWRSDWISASSGVQLTVTDLQVKVDPNTVGQREVKVTCSSTCRLNTHRYYWYKNEHNIKYTEDASIVLYSTSHYDEGNYSCKVSESEYRSPPVCVLGKQCWGVTYTAEHVCALKNTSVDLSCSYKYPAGHTVIKSVWFFKKQVNVEPEDVRTDEEYQGRVQYTQSSQNDCSLRITNLRERDAQTYRFRFHTDDAKGKYTEEPGGVTLSVTDLKVTVSDLDNWNKKLSCITTCTLSNKPTYIWYKNGQRVTDQDRNELEVSSEDAGSFSCAVRGHEELHSPAVYSPKNTTAVVLSSGDTVEGDSVTLSCSSDANPPVLTYSWFKQCSAADTLLRTGQNYSISNISSQHTGLYYCTAHNQLGHQDSTPTHLDVFYSPENTRAVVLSSGDTVEGDSVTLSCSSDANPPVLTYSWFKQSSAADTLLITGQNYSISNISSQHTGLYYCTAHNQLGHHNSTPTHLDVFYPPRNLSVTVIPSVSGDMVTLLCTSDSNPNSSYTWYRKTKEGVKLIRNGTSLTLSSRADGFHYCTARNGFGSSNSSEWPYTPERRVVKFVVSGFAIALILSFSAVILWMRRKSPVLSITENSKIDSAPVYGNVSAMTSDPTQTVYPEDQDMVQYSSVFFQPTHTQEVPLYSTVQLPKALNQEEEVEYATVNLIKSRADRKEEIYNNLKS